MISTGIVAVVTAGDSPVTILNPGIAPLVSNYQNITINNSGTISGFFSVDGGATWCYLRPSSDTTLLQAPIPGPVLVKRIPGGTDLAGVFAYAWRLS